MADTSALLTCLAGMLNNYEPEDDDHWQLEDTWYYIMWWSCSPSHLQQSLWHKQIIVLGCSLASYTFELIYVNYIWTVIRACMHPSFVPETDTYNRAFSCDVTRTNWPPFCCRATIQWWSYTASLHSFRSSLATKPPFTWTVRQMKQLSCVKPTFCKLERSK